MFSGIHMMRDIGKYRDQCHQQTYHLKSKYHLICLPSVYDTLDLGTYVNRLVWSDDIARHI